MSNLSTKHCVVCESGTEPLMGLILERHIEDLGGNWTVINDHHIEKEFFFKDFKEALAFVDKIGLIADEEGHHPDIHLTWGKVRVLLWTHNINGLSPNDFILASKIDLIK